MATQLVAITGNTYPVKESLKALGARWNPDKKAWMVAADVADRARQIVAGAGAQAPRSGYSRWNNARGNYAPGGRKCPYCGSRECPKAFNPRDLCDED